jgi:hypothetical protein
MFKQKEKSNQDLRDSIKNLGFHQYEVAKILGMEECLFSRALRYELSDNAKKEIIGKIKKELGE